MLIDRRAPGHGRGHVPDRNPQSNAFASPLGNLDLVQVPRRIVVDRGPAQRAQVLNLRLEVDIRQPSLDLLHLLGNPCPELRPESGLMHLVQGRLGEIEAASPAAGRPVAAVCLRTGVAPRRMLYGCWLRALLRGLGRGPPFGFRHAPETRAFLLSLYSGSIVRLPLASREMLRRASPHAGNRGQYGMVRPCFLVIDREHPGSISTRKLVLETAKFNVITAYSASEALETLALFPNISGVVLDAVVRDVSCNDLIAEIKAVNAKLPMVVISSPGTHHCPQADYLLETFDPVPLLTLLQGLVPDATASIEEQNQRLGRQ